MMNIIRRAQQQVKSQIKQRIWKALDIQQLVKSQIMQSTGDKYNKEGTATGQKSNNANGVIVII